MQLYPLFLLLPFISAFPTDKPHAHSQQHRRACALPALNDTTFPGITLGNVTSAIDIGGSRFDYGNTKIRGVNLGGVMARPGEFYHSFALHQHRKRPDHEWTFCQNQDRSVAESTLRQHWESFITEDDFVQISAAGLNHVRIPVGYWSWDVQGDEPFIQGAAEYLDKAIGWARSHHTKVLIDLHGAPGSQNGFDHSGRKGPAGWHTDPNKIKRTVDLVQRLSAKYGAPEYSDTVTMFELLNEPTLWLGAEIQTATKQFYLDAYGVARRPWGDNAGNKTNWIVVFHDGFQRMDWWKDYMGGNAYEKVWIDDHYYQAFGQQFRGISAEEHLREVCKQRDNYATSPFPSIGGEWSIGLADCAAAEWTSAMGPIGKCELSVPNFAKDYATFMTAYFDLQVQLYENVGQGQGWFYFNWKTEDYAEWSYQLALRNGWIPQAPGEHQFSLDTICAAA